MENELKKCICTDCGKSFNKGDEGDNETICLRCELIFMAQIPIDEYHEYLGDVV